MNLSDSGLSLTQRLITHSHNLELVMFRLAGQAERSDAVAEGEMILDASVYISFRDWFCSAKRHCRDYLQSVQVADAMHESERKRRRRRRSKSTRVLRMLCG